MTFALASDELIDVELLRLVRSGDASAAARIWVRHWPTALDTARTLVDAAEVPGLAAEALVGTLAAVALGYGPDGDLEGFVVDAVRELGEDEDAPPPTTATATYPDVFPSVTLGEVFAPLPVEDRQLLWASVAQGRDDADLASVLRTSRTEVARRRTDLMDRLTRDYVAAHVTAGTSTECIDAHAELDGAASAGPAALLPTRTWVHLSECVVCTEAFHELAHSTVALAALLGPAADPGPVVAPPRAARASAPAVSVPAAVVPAVVVAPQDAEVVAAAVDPEPPTHKRRSRKGERSRRRLAVVAALIVVLVGGVAALAAGMGGGGGGTTPPSAKTPPTTTGPTSPSTDPVISSPSEPLDENPTPASQAPTPTITAKPTKAATTAAPVVPTPTKKPTRKPSGPTSSPPATPTPTPTKKPCNLVNHLLGIC
ncbi:MAG: hypothetical protein ACJ72D_18145 [Marmoricola sp.]